MLAVRSNKEKLNKHAAEKRCRCWEKNWRIKCDTGQMFSITNNCENIFFMTRPRYLLADTGLSQTYRYVCICWPIRGGVKLTTHWHICFRENHAEKDILPPLRTVCICVYVNTVYTRIYRFFFYTPLSHQPQNSSINWAILVTDVEHLTAQAKLNHSQE